MKKLISTLIFFVIVSVPLFAQNITTEENVDSDDSPVYQLYPTQNMWTFLKLDTQTGRIWQVQWSLDDDSDMFQTSLSIENLAIGKEKKNGRFKLVPTTNMYNFLLLDQIDGEVWQVQWSHESKNRLVIKIE